MSEKGVRSPVITPGRQRRKRLIGVILFTVVLFAMLFWGTNYLLRSFTHESTDDASLERHIISISPKVARQVSAVYVTHNQLVNTGDPLFEIDPRDFNAARDPNT